MTAKHRPWEVLAWAGIILLALVMRIGVSLNYEAQHPLADRPVIDERSYETWALEIAAGDWVGDEVFFQEPLYPYWLATVISMLGPERIGLRHMQAGLGAVLVLLILFLTRRLFGVAPALIAGLAAATYRPLLLFPCYLLKPNLFLPIFTLLCLVGIASASKAGKSNWRGWALVGVLGGLGALLRGNLLILLPALLLWPPVAAKLRGRAFAAGLWGSLGMALGCLAMLLPVALRNYSVGGVFALTTSGAGTNVYGGNNRDNLYGRAMEFDWVRGIPEYEADDWRHEAERRVGASMNPNEVSSYWLGEVGRSIREDPLLHLQILWNKLRLSLGAYEVPDNHHLAWDAKFLDSKLLLTPGFGLWGMLGLAGLLKCGWKFLRRGSIKTEDPARLEIILAFAAYLLTIVLTVTSMRARLALVPLLLPFAGFACVELGRQIMSDKRRGQALRGWLAALALAALCVHLPVIDSERRARDFSTRQFNLASYLADEPDGLEGAKAIVSELDSQWPGSSRVINLRAELMFREARELLQSDPSQTAAVRALLQNALDLLHAVVSNSGVNLRERFRARVLSGAVQEFLGNGSGAEGHYRAAREFDPEDAGLMRGLANALMLQLGSGGYRASVAAEAEGLYRAALLKDDLDQTSRLGLANVLFLRGSSYPQGPQRESALDGAQAELERLRSAPGVDGNAVQGLLQAVEEARRP